MSDAGLSYCQIMVGRAMAGLVGLREGMEALALRGVAADTPGLGARLLEEAGRHNYIPRGAITEYEAALIREYREYLEARATGQDERPWRDPRKELKPWYPTLFAEKCDGCGRCVPVCPNRVLGWDPEHVKVLVLEPYECALGCELCAKACPTGAIIMPPRAMLHQRTDSPSNRF